MCGGDDGSTAAAVTEELVVLEFECKGDGFFTGETAGFFPSFGFGLVGGGGGLGFFLGLSVEECG